MNNLIPNTTVASNDNGLGFLNLNQLLKPVSADNFYIVLSFVVFSLFLIGAIYLERRFEIQKREKRSQRQQFIKNMEQASQRLGETFHSKAKTALFDNEDRMLEHAI